MKKKNRSDSYQYRHLEISIPDEIMNIIPANDGIGFWLEDKGAEVKDRVAELRERLAARMWELAKGILTERGFGILRGYFYDGYTQQELSKIMGCNQSCIVKAIYGAGGKDWAQGIKNARVQKFHHYGTLYRLQKKCMSDPQIRMILMEIKLLQQE